MDLKEAIEILKQHNLWRRGKDDIPMQHPFKIGDAIDFVVEYLENQDKPKKEYYVK